jgi:hypothetical protein
MEHGSTTLTSLSTSVRVSQTVPTRMRALLKARPAAGAELADVAVPDVGKRSRETTSRLWP